MNQNSCGLSLSDMSMIHGLNSLSNGSLGPLGVDDSYFQLVVNLLDDSECGPVLKRELEEMGLQDDCK